MAVNDKVFVGGMPLSLSKRSATQYDLVTNAQNVTTKDRDAFESYAPIPFGQVPADGDKWYQSKASGDVVTVDGNAIAASWLDISLDPLNAGTETIIESVANYSMPLEFAFHVHMSQRTLGQEFAIEVIDTAEQLPDVAEIAISSLNQATTTLTIITTAPHGLTPGKSIGTYGFADSRANYPALVVASIPNTTTFTATAGPGGTIPSLTLTALTGGFVYFRERLGRANEGTSMIFENVTATNASFYIRSEKGDALPSGTAIGNHSATILTTASVQAINAANTYAFQPTSVYKLRMMIDKLQWSNAPVDTLATETAVVTRDQVIPSPDATYKLRIRAVNNKALSVPVAHINNVAKTGTTTATVTTQTPHGLTTGDVIAAYGARDQVNFANLTAATAVASVIDANNFTVVWGSAVTASSQAGVIYRVQGGNLPSTLGVIAQAIQSVVRTSNVLTLVGSASWSGLLIGDRVNIAALHDITGTDLLLDGVYRVRNVAATSLELEVIYANDGVTPISPVGNDIVLTNCGGIVIKRTSMRVSASRVIDFERHRIEATPRPAGDQSGVMPVNIQNAIAATISSGTITNGQAAHDAVIAGAPHRVAGRAATANYTAVATGDTADYITTTVGVGIVKANSIPELEWQTVLTITNTTSTAIQATAGAGLKRYMNQLTYQNTNATATVFNILRGATVIGTFSAAASMANPVPLPFPTPLQTAANEALNVQAVTTGANLIINAQGFTAP